MVKDSQGFVGSSIGSSLLLRVREHDPFAWQKIVDVYGPLIYRWCRQAGIAEEAAADVGQEVFRAIAKSIGRFQKDHNSGSFVGWMRQITRFKIADYQRSLYKSPIARGGSEFLDQLQRVPQLDSLPDPQQADEKSGAAQDEDQCFVVQRILSMMKSSFRENTWRAFWATAVDQRTTADVADELGMSAMAVRKAKSRVLKRLRDEFGDVMADWEA